MLFNRYHLSSSLCVHFHCHCTPPEIMEVLKTVSSESSVARMVRPDEDLELSDSDMESFDNDELSDSDVESESDEDDAVKLTEPSKTAVFNREGLLDKLGDISWPENVDWIHKLTVDIHQEKEVDVNDDLNRELAFYTQALNGTRAAFEKLKSIGLPFLRPPDYYAEMVKSDTHMVKVKGRLLAEKKQIEEAEERRKAREAKKISKEVQAQKQKERAQQKKHEIESVKKWRKDRQKSGFEKNGDFSSTFEDGKTFERSNKKRPGVSPWDRSGGKAKQGGKIAKKGKRDVKDSKFGYGGKKGMKKQNTAETTNDFKGYNKGKSGDSQNRKRKR